MEAARISIRPAMWRWACERAGTNAAALADKFPKLSDWMDGASSPTIRQARDFAKSVHLPFMYLLLSKPIKEEVPIADFRRVGNRQAAKPSLDLLDTIRACKQRQAWYSDRLAEDGAEPLDFVGSLTVDMDVIAAAETIRKRLEWEPAEQNRRNTFEAFREKAESAGILVMVDSTVGSNSHRLLSVQEFRGFALADDHMAPLVFINGRDAPAARLFTLAHEITHVFLGSSGISAVKMNSRLEPGLEGWCNRVAAEILVPTASLRGLLPTTRPSDLGELVAELSKKFHVSKMVILLRLRGEKWLSASDFDCLWAQEKAAAARRSGGGGVDYYRTQVSRVSPTFATEMVRCVLEGRESYTSAFRMLGVKNADSLRKMGDALGVL